MAEEKKYKVNEQLIGDFVATIDSKPNLTKQEIFSKFPEFKNDEGFLQSMVDYRTTLKSGKYKSEVEARVKFPELEFGDVKKKDLSQQGSASGFAPSRGIKPGTSVFPQQQFSVEEQAKPMPVEERYKQPQAEGGAVELAKYLYNKSLEGIGNYSSGLTDVFSQIAVQAMPDEFLGGKTKEEAVKNIRTDVLPSIRTGTQKIAGAEQKSVEKKRYDENFITGALGGVAATLPALITPNGIGLFAQAYDGGLQSVNNSKLADQLSETEKTAFASSVGLVGALLEKYSFDKLMKLDNKFVNELSEKVAIRVLNQFADQGIDRVTPKMFNKAASEILSAGAKKLTKLGGNLTLAGGIEGVTGGTQETANIGIEEVLNKYKGKQIFEPQSYGEIIGRVAKATGQEAIGGVTLRGGIDVVVGSYDLATARRVGASNNPQAIEEAIVDIDNQVSTGQITQDERDNLVAAIDKGSEIDTKIPSDLEGDARDEANELITMRNDLDDAIIFISQERDATDPAFRTSYDGRIENEESKKAVINDAIVGLTAPIIYRQVEGGFQKESNGKVEDITEAQFNFAKDNGFTGIKIEEQGGAVTKPTENTNTRIVVTKETINNISEAELNSLYELLSDSDKQAVLGEYNRNIDKIYRKYITSKQKNTNEDFTSAVESLINKSQPTSAVTEEGGVVENRIADIETELQDPDITEERIQELNTEKEQLNATQESSQQITQGGEQGNQLQREGTQEGQPQIGKGEGSQGQTTQSETDSGDSNIEGQGDKKKRGFVESAQNAPTTESIADALENNPESFYTPVSIDEGKAVVDAMTEDQKKNIIDKVVDFFDSIKGDNIAVLAGIDLINEYMAKGDVKSAEAIVEKLASVGTAAGRLIQQFATLQSSNPVSFTFALDKVLDKYGIELTDAQRKSLQELFVNQKETSDNLQKSIDKYAEDLSKESYAEMMQALEVNRKAIDAMTKKLGRILPKSVFETLGMTMQGNMLVLKSLLSNPVYNALFVPIRLTKKEVANLVDSFFTKFIFTDSGRVLSSGVNKDNIKYSIPAAWDGIIKAWNKTWRGSVSETDLSRIEMNRSLNPIEAAKQIRMQVTELWYDTLKKEYNEQERIAKKAGQKFDGERFVANLIEAVPGTPANVMLRLLAFGDDPFFEPARVSELVGIGQRKGLSGDALQSFIINPDKESAQAAIDVAKEAVFQQDNSISDLINFFHKTINAYFKDFPMIADAANFFIIKTMLPFVKTPSNVFAEVLKYAVPVIPAAKFSYAIAQALKNERLMDNATTVAQKNKYKKEFDKNRRDFAEGFSEFAISMALWSVGMALSSAGLIEGEEDEENKKNPKLKAYSYATKGGPLSLNIDGTIRLFKGEDPSPRPGDKKISLNSIGIAGASFYITYQATKEAPAKTAQYDFETGKQLEGKPNYKGEYFKNILSTLPASGQFMLNQSFTQGAGALATALETNEWDKFMLQITKAGTTAFLPNTIDNFNRANREFMKVPYGETFSENYINFLKMKFGKDDDLPIRRGLFGEKITQNPKGANPTVYQFFDIFKTADMYQMPIYFKIDVLLNQSKKQLGDPDLKLIPDIPDRTIVYNGKTYPLKPKWHELLQKEVGDARLPLVMEILGNNESYSEDLSTRLDAAYKLGSDIGTQEFLSKYGQNLNEN